MSSAIDLLMVGLERLLACAPCPARMLHSPFWTGATHVVQLRPIRIEQRGREPAPSPRRRAQDPPRSRAREQHSRDIRVCECTHFGPPWVAASIAVLPMSENVVQSRRLLHSTQVGPPDVLVEPTPYLSLLSHVPDFGGLQCLVQGLELELHGRGQTCDPRQRLISVILQSK